MVRDLQKIRLQGIVTLCRVQELQDPLFLNISRKQQGVVPVPHSRHDGKIVVVLILAADGIVGGRKKVQLQAPDGLFRPAGQPLHFDPCRRLEHFFILRSGAFVIRKDDLLHFQRFQDGIGASDVVLVKMGQDHQVHRFEPKAFEMFRDLFAVILFTGIDEDRMTAAPAAVRDFVDEDDGICFSDLQEGYGQGVVGRRLPGIVPAALLSGRDRLGRRFCFSGRSIRCRPGRCCSAGRKKDQHRHQKCRLCHTGQDMFCSVSDRVMHADPPTATFSSGKGSGRK